MERKARASRVALVPLLRLSLQYPLGNEKLLPLLNISRTGFALSRSSAGTVLKDAKETSSRDGLQGRIDSKVITFRVVRVGDSILGCQIHDPDQSIGDWIESILNAELSAQKMKPRKKSAEEGETYWFSGGENCELYYTVTGEQIDRFTLCFFGNYIKGGEQRPYLYGEALSDELTAPAPSRKVKKAPTEEFLRRSIQFLHNIPDLPLRHIELLTKLILRG